MGNIGTRTLRAAVLAVATVTLFAGGCAQEPLGGPSHVGLSSLTLGTEAEAAPVEDAMSPAVRHVSSNKVLGAIAFQKVTGRSVDARRLIGSE